MSVDAFCRLFQLHCQPQKVFVDEDDEESEVQNGCCTFVPRKPNNKVGLDKVVFSPAPKEQVGGELAGVLVLRQDRISGSRRFGRREVSVSFVYRAI